MLAELKPDFPDISVSKIRFLETQGLITPDRTPKGYRVFSEDDVERLRYVLAAQRDNFLPLRVIKDHLAAMDRGLEVPSSSARVVRPTVPDSPDPTDGGAVAGTEPAAEPAGSAHVRLTTDELLAMSGLDVEDLTALTEMGLMPRPQGSYYDANAARIAQSAATMRAYGLHPRHLRGYRLAADREVGLIEQAAAGVAPGRRTEARQELTRASTRLRTALIRAALE